MALAIRQKVCSLDLASIIMTTSKAVIVYSYSLVDSLLDGLPVGWKQLCDVTVKCMLAILMGFTHIFLSSSCVNFAEE